MLIIVSCKTLKVSKKEYTPIDLSEDISYSNHIKPIIENNCLTCHSGEFASANLTLEKYEEVIAAIKNDGLLNRINNHEKPMPTSGLMPKNARMTFQKWADNDFLKVSENPVKQTEEENFVFNPPTINAVDIEKNGFEFMNKIQGHWTGKMFLLGQKLPWFSFDFRAINTSQVHGMFEGGSMGNLFNTFFVGEFKGTKTIMLRNGGILSGIYRTSYFVLTEANENEYLFVDAYGGKDIMWVKIKFGHDKMNMTTYTSKFGSVKSSRHMEFEGKLQNEDLAQQAAEKFNYPTKTVFKSFPNGMPKPDWGKEYETVTSASYMMMADSSMDYETLGKWAQDPIQISDLENIARLNLVFERDDLSRDKNISVYLSREPLTDSNDKMKMEYDYISMKAMNQVILFPQINKNQKQFELTYLHTGKCYITFVVDNNKDMVPNKGDFYSKSIELNLNSETIQKLSVNMIDKSM